MWKLWQRLIGRKNWNKIRTRDLIGETIESKWGEDARGTKVWIGEEGTKVVVEIGDGYERLDTMGLVLSGYNCERIVESWEVKWVGKSLQRGVG